MSLSAVFIVTNCSSFCPMAKNGSANIGQSSLCLLYLGCKTCNEKNFNSSSSRNSSVTNVDELANLLVFLVIKRLGMWHSQVVGCSQIHPRNCTCFMHAVIIISKQNYVYYYIPLGSTNSSSHFFSGKERGPKEIEFFLSLFWKELGILCCSRPRWRNEQGKFFLTHLNYVFLFETLDPNWKLHAVSPSRSAFQGAAAACKNVFLGLEFLLGKNGRKYLTFLKHGFFFLPSSAFTTLYHRQIIYSLVQAFEYSSLSCANKIGFSLCCIVIPGHTKRSYS